MFDVDTQKEFKKIPGSQFGLGRFDWNGIKGPPCEVRLTATRFGRFFSQQDHCIPPFSESHMHK